VVWTCIRLFGSAKRSHTQHMKKLWTVARLHALTIDSTSVWRIADALRVDSSRRITTAFGMPVFPARPQCARALGVEVTKILLSKVGGLIDTLLVQSARLRCTVASTIAIKPSALHAYLASRALAARITAVDLSASRTPVRLHAFAQNVASWRLTNAFMVSARLSVHIAGGIAVRIAA
jgi:hypothetical protein